MPPDNISNDLSNSQLYDLLIKAIKDQTDVLKSEININIQDLSNKVETVDTKNTAKLKNLGVDITNDMPYEDRQVQRVLKVSFRNTKRQNHQARIRGNKLEIDGKFFTLGDLRNLEELVSEDNSSGGSRKRTALTTKRTEGNTKI
ncbi:unnamed protein product [Psylliodes chrysocephalus]|uniref:Uncharacterized protein n=1 Tax=Psylliodes chrysocephalus TaxID=3402493 RepID=A0A9P0D0I8_9CUCU|nr:unnamed protein product [Psylliodes chrysocephala]